MALIMGILWVNCYRKNIQKNSILQIIVSPIFISTGRLFSPKWPKIKNWKQVSGYIVRPNQKSRFTL